MPGRSARDKCFEEATDAYNDAVPDNEKIKIEHQKPWAMGDDGKWKPLGMLESIWGYIKNLAPLLTAFPTGLSRSVANPSREIINSRATVFPTAEVPAAAIPSARIKTR